MYCPNCGIEASLSQKFCRSCGLSLEKVPLLLGEKLSVADPAELSDQHVESLKVRQRKIDHWLSLTGYGFISLTIISVITGIVYLVVNKNMPLLPGIVILLCLLGGAIAAFFAIYSDFLKKMLAENDPPKSRALPLTEIAAKHPFQASREELISVTEHTTKSLERSDTGGERKRAES